MSEACHFLRICVYFVLESCRYGQSPADEHKRCYGFCRKYLNDLLNREKRTSWYPDKPRKATATHNNGIAAASRAKNLDKYDRPAIQG